MASGSGPINPKGTRTTLPEICSFSIPLITIVATFVFELFLPIVTLLFGLLFMLKLKFCILPEVSLAAGVTAEIALDAAVMRRGVAVGDRQCIDAELFRPAGNRR